MERVLDRMRWPLHTERLLIRPAEWEDAETTWPFRRLPEVNHWITRAPADHDEYVDLFRRPSSLDLTLVIERDLEVIGDLMLHVNDPWAQVEVREQAAATQAELGWCLHPDHGGKGCATEAVAALITASFEQLGLRRITAECFADNTASWRLMERLGMRREAHTRKDSLHRSGEWMDGLLYAVLREEWQQP
ncbi:GNAT family N-acetyltransferase [Nocardioides sp. JQ2195]|uniref:GNAT family N-acetyltransferase n=1 Tax=Nocardioides sp. JQ2195 TaxID=2592334 RepID=UPI00143E5EDE|nr:GNAT family N-acetyltransferase [Nocardioides sp. JQ2195]QIX28393.1 GNAT family N-acetyltransferase [Nocardioides sp. JQ2195]